MQISSVGSNHILSGVSQENHPMTREELFDKLEKRSVNVEQKLLGDIMSRGNAQNQFWLKA